MKEKFEKREAKVENIIRSLQKELRRRLKGGEEKIKGSREATLV